MAGNAENGGGRRGRFWRIAPWVIAALLMLLPLVAMRFTDEVVWDEIDFAVMGALLFSACGACELAARMTRNSAYRAAVGALRLWQPSSSFGSTWPSASSGLRTIPQT
jgi:hypothetical protein